MGAEAAAAGALGSLPIRLQQPCLILPAEPTENHIYWLSNLDQNIVQTIETVYFYQAEEKMKHADPAGVLRDSLAKVLVHYPPLAGKLGISADMKLEVVCKGEGVLFLEADADATLAEMTDSISLSQFVQSLEDAKGFLELPVMSVQVTRFKCGGFAVGLAMRHTLLDGIAAMEFLSSWAETSRGLQISNPPVLDRSNLKHRDPLNIQHPHIEFSDIQPLPEYTPLQSSQKVLYRSFCFDDQSLEALKAHLLQDGQLKKCTTFEAVTALVWHARTKALNIPASQHTKLLFAVDVRSKFVPPLPKGYFGNGICFTCSMVTAQELLDHSLSHAVALVQQAIQMMDDSYMRSGIDFFEKTRARPSLTSTLVITSWSRLPLHSIDHGWGAPWRSGPVTLPAPEVALLLPYGKERKSIKLVLGLPTDAMKKFSQYLREDYSLQAQLHEENDIEELTFSDIF